jgi:hypothetical protein
VLVLVLGLVLDLLSMGMVCSDEPGT